PEIGLHPHSGQLREAQRRVFVTCSQAYGFLGCRFRTLNSSTRCRSSFKEHYSSSERVPIACPGCPFMKLRLVTIGLLIAIVGCGSKSSNPPLLSSLPRSYNGTASVGDFLTITLDPAALTLTYKNLSNGDAATIPYTVNP